MLLLSSIFVFLQNADLQSRVHYLEGCECVRQRCVWEGREVEDGQRWQVDLNTVCTCASGKVTCQANIKGKGDSAADSSLSLAHPFHHLLSLFNSVAHRHTHTKTTFCFDTLNQNTNTHSTAFK